MELRAQLTKLDVIGLNCSLDPFREMKQLMGVKIEISFF